MTDPSGDLPLPGLPFPPPGFPPFPPPPGAFPGDGRFPPFPPPFLLGPPAPGGEFPPFPLPGTLPPFRPPDVALPMASAGAITVVSQLFRRWTDRQSERNWGISGPRLHVLSVLANAGPTTMGNLATILHVTPRAVTRLVDGLEAQGYVTRESDAHDRRSVKALCTPEGERIASSFLPGHFVSINQLFDGIEPARLRVFFDVISELGERLGQDLWPKPEHEPESDPDSA